MAEFIAIQSTWGAPQPYQATVLTSKEDMDLLAYLSYRYLQPPDWYCLVYISEVSVLMIK